MAGLLSASFGIPCWRNWHPAGVEAPDLPGFGQRPRPGGLQPSLASYAAGWASHSLEQAGNRPIVGLVGHSLGGSLALHAASLLGDHLLEVIQSASAEVLPGTGLRRSAGRGAPPCCAFRARAGWPAGRNRLDPQVP